MGDLLAPISVLAFFFSSVVSAVPSWFNFSRISLAVNQIDDAILLAHLELGLTLYRCPVYSRPDHFSAWTRVASGHGDGTT
jgi:hypothetical protein